MRNFLIISNSVDTTKSLSLNSLTNYGRLDVICRCISASFFLSNNFRKDVTLKIFFRINSKILEIKGNKVRGINPDERAIAGVLKRVFEGSNHVGIKFYSERLKDILTKQEFVVLDLKGTKSFDRFQKINFFLIGDQLGFLEQDLPLISDLKKLSLGNQEYLSSQTITILNFLLDTI
ncbi:MAG: hypothetical protein ACXAC8_01375 [Candidatus Hodarchaeales archaeon]|jgi:tRNA (pseudouridine54-N1)-methyltransferase